jgi:hypothetical protein
MTRARHNSTKQTPWEDNHILPPTYFFTTNFSINLSSTPTSSNWSETRRAQIFQKSISHLKNVTPHWKFSRHGDLVPGIYVPLFRRNNECTNCEAITNLMHHYLYSYNITTLYMFRALLYSSSGGQIVYILHLVPSISVCGCTLHWLRER